MMKNYMQKMKKDQRGLTLVELLAVVVILAIVAAIAFVVIGNVIDNTKKDAQVSNAQQMISSAKLYESTEGKSIGTSGVKATDLQKVGVLSQLTDPWDKENYTDIENAVVTTNGKTDETRTYTVKLKDNNSNCVISSTEAQLNEKGRERCNKTD